MSSYDPLVAVVDVKDAAATLTGSAFVRRPAGLADRSMMKSMKHKQKGRSTGYILRTLVSLRRMKSI